MNLFLLKSFFMGVVEGLTEFLPVSSTGHLIIAGDLINFVGSFPVMFEIFIQLGAIFAVIFYYRHKIWNSFKNLRIGQWGFNLWAKVLVAFLPSAIIGLALNDYVETHFFNPFNVSIALFLGAILILVVEKYHSAYRINNIDDISFKNAFFIGVVQCLSLMPGMSRSSSTIVGGLLVGLSAKTAAEFSFFLAIPTMFAASIYSLIKQVHNNSISVLELESLSIGFITTFFVALIVIHKFMVFLGSHKLTVFAYYRIAVSLLMLSLIIGKII